MTVPQSEFVRLYRLIADLFEQHGYRVYSGYDEQAATQVQGLALERYVDQRIGVADDEAVWLQELRDRLAAVTDNG